MSLLPIRILLMLAFYYLSVDLCAPVIVILYRFEWGWYYGGHLIRISTTHICMPHYCTILAAAAASINNPPLIELFVVVAWPPSKERKKSSNIQKKLFSPNGKSLNLNHSGKFIATENSVVFLFFKLCSLPPLHVCWLIKLIFTRTHWRTARPEKVPIKKRWSTEICIKTTVTERRKALSQP